MSGAGSGSVGGSGVDELGAGGDGAVDVAASPEGRPSSCRGAVGIGVERAKFSNVVASPLKI